jgi:hypothetical protein
MLNATPPPPRNTLAIVAASAHSFFAASASVAGALIGLLFVAISVTHESGTTASEVDDVRARAALTAFTNALAVSLFGLVPGIHVGIAATVVAIIGLLFICGALFRVIPAWRDKRLRLWDLSFLVGLLIVFAYQLRDGLGLATHIHNQGYLETICTLVIVCFFLGIARAWELVGGPNAELGHQLYTRLRGRRRETPPEG